VFPQSLHSTGGSTSAAVLLKQLPGRLLVSSAAEEQEERQLRVPAAAVLLTAAAAVDDDASCFSKMATFDREKIHRSMEISPRCRLSSRRIITNTFATKKARKCVRRLLCIVGTFISNNYCNVKKKGIKISVAYPDPGSGVFSDPWIRSGIQIRAGSGMNITGLYFRELSNKFFGLKILKISSRIRKTLRPKYRIIGLSNYHLTNNRMGHLWRACLTSSALISMGWWCWF
jgi:hypothetical protein